MIGGIEGRRGRVSGGIQMRYDRRHRLRGKNDRRLSKGESDNLKYHTVRREGGIDTGIGGFVSNALHCAAM